METDTLTTSNDSPDTSVFELPVADNDLLTLVKEPVQSSEKYWENEFGLKKARTSNINLWLPNHWKDKDVYDYQEEYLYQDNRIFVSVETICSVVNARIPQPEVMPGQEGVISEQIAKDLGKVLYAWAERYRVPDLFRIGTRNLLLKRVGYLKLRFDESVGEHGEIVPEIVAPEDIVVDQDARFGDVPRFVAQKLRNKTAEELIAMFPEAEAKVHEMIGGKRLNSQGQPVIYKTQLGKKFNIWELWFRYYDKDKKRYAGGLAFVDEHFTHVLSKDKNPNWNYEDEYSESQRGSCSNLLDFPAPPFFPINYLNDGTTYIDATSMVEQAAPLQRVLDRRGFQIMENAEQSGSGLIFNTNMITKEDISKLTGSPDERIGVKGDVRSAVVRVAPPPLPNYVIEDKMDARSEIDNIFATHDISRGAQSNNKTLGQDQLQQGQDYTRMDDIARAIERTATLFYRYVVQMMKVYYTEDHWFKATGEDGKFDFIVMKSDMIEDGLDVNVEAGSTLPVNKRSQQDFIVKLAEQGLVDPLTLYEVGSGGVMPSPKKMLERFLTFKVDPTAFMTNLKAEQFNRQAFMDVQILLRGELPDTRNEISQEYLQFMTNYMLGGDFDKQPPIVKQLFSEWLRVCQAQALKQIQNLQTQSPTQEEMDAAAQKEAETTAMSQAIGGGGPEAAAQMQAQQAQGGQNGQPTSGNSSSTSAG
jgi:hypothetical protein